LTEADFFFGADFLALDLAAILVEFELKNERVRGRTKVERQ
jgi:hypothetical protein